MAVGPEAEELVVHAEFPKGVPASLQVDRFAHPYLLDLELQTASGWRPVPRSGTVWRVPECHARGCELRYRYLLGQAAAQINRVGFAALRGGVLLAPPSTWLIHPREYAGADRYRLKVSTAAPGSFVSGVWRSSHGDGSREAPAELLFQAPYSGFARFRQERWSVGGGRIELSVAAGGPGLALPLPALRSAVSHAAELVAAYFGRFPVPEVAVIVLPSAGAGLSGRQLGNGGASILLFVGRELRRLGPRHAGILAHEMFHLAFPSLPGRHLWMAEGLATYQELLVRARAGCIDARELWRQLIAGLPAGVPRPGDGGLDGTRSWGRTYWGGALFFLLADLAIRTESKQRFSLDDAARGILEAGGDTAVRWTARQTLAAGDRAVRATTLRDLYAAHAGAAAAVDLPELFRRLGVHLEAGEVVFDEGAEWAGVRRALASGPPQGAHVGLACPGVPKSPL